MANGGQDKNAVALLTLPNEMLVEIFGLLDPVRLAPIALVNRHLNAIVTPLLYGEYIADPNIICNLPIATKLPARHVALVKRLRVWGQHPSDGQAAFARCTNLAEIVWDLGLDPADICHFSTASFSESFMCMLTSLRIELATSFRGIIYLKYAQPFRWLTESFSRCTSLRHLRICPLRYELPPTTEFVPFGGPVAREQELVDVVDSLFGNTLEHLALEWCPPYRKTAPNMLLDSRLNSTTGFRALRVLEIPFSSNIATKATPNGGYWRAPSYRKTLYHAHKISLLRPHLKIKNLQLQNNYPLEFTPLLMDLKDLTMDEVLDFWNWLCDMFPRWNRQFLVPHEPLLSDTALQEAVRHLVTLNLPFGLRHHSSLVQIHHTDQSFQLLVSLANPVLRSLILEIPNRDDISRWILWLELHSLPLLPQLDELGIITPPTEQPRLPLKSAAPLQDQLQDQLQNMLVMLVQRYMLKTLTLSLPREHGQLRWLGTCTSLKTLRLWDATFEEDEELQGLYDTLALLSQLERLEITGWVRDRERRMTKIRNGIFEALGQCERCSVMLNLKDLIANGPASPVY